jgi:hypothetical protein
LAISFEINPIPELKKMMFNRFEKARCRKNFKKNNLTLNLKYSKFVYSLNKLTNDIGRGLLLSY